MDLSPTKVRITFDRAMAMLGRRDHRSYAQVVSHKCVNTFRSVRFEDQNAGLLWNTEVTDNTSVGTVSMRAKDIDFLVIEYIISIRILKKILWVSRSRFM